MSASCCHGHLGIPIQTPNGSYLIGARRYVLTYPETSLLTPGVHPYTQVFVPFEVPTEARAVWAAGFLSGSKRRVHDRDLPRTTDDPPPIMDGQPNLKKPRSAEQ